MFTISLLASFLASALLIFTVIYGLYKNFKDKIVRYYCYFGFCSFGILFTMFLTYAFPTKLNLTLINKITQVSTILSFSALFILSLIFPKSEKEPNFKTIVIILLPAYIISIVILFTDYSITKAYIKNNRLIREFQFFYTVYLVFAFAYIIMAIINFTYKYIKTTIEIYKKQMRFVFIGTGISMSLAAVFSIIMPRFYNYTDLYVLGPSIAAFIGVSSLFYAVISYQMMDIRTALHKTIIYTVTSTVILVPIFLILYVYETYFISNKSLPLYIVIFIIVLTFLFISKYIQPYIDEIFKRKQHEIEDIFNTFIKDIAYINNINEIIQKFTSTIHNTFFLKKSYFLFYNDNSRTYEPVISLGEPVVNAEISRNTPIIRWFNRNHILITLDRIYFDENLFEGVKNDFLTYFEKHDIYLMIPLYHRGMLVGIICLGQKDTLAAFKTDELELLEFLTSETNLHLSHTITYHQVKKEQLQKHNIEITSNILSKTIPNKLPILSGIKFGAFYIPRKGGGVDYFDFLRPSIQEIGILSTDISSTGINSALYSVLMRSVLHSSIGESYSSYNIIQKMNQILYDFSKGKSELVTAIYCYIDVRNMRLIFTNAGFPPLLLFRIEKNNIDLLDTEGIPLGYDPGFNYGMGRTSILRGDIGIIYSKSLITTKNAKDELFTIEHIKQLIKDNRFLNPQELANIISNSFKNFMGIALPESDISVIIFKIY